MDLIISINSLTNLLINLSSDHFCSTDGFYELNDAYYCGITEKINSSEIKYEYNFLMEDKDWIYDILKDGFRGFEKYSDEELARAYDDKFGED